MILHPLPLYNEIQCTLLLFAIWGASFYRVLRFVGIAKCLGSSPTSIQIVIAFTSLDWENSWQGESLQRGRGCSSFPALFPGALSLLCCCSLPALQTPPSASAHPLPDDPSLAASPSIVRWDIPWQDVLALETGPAPLSSPHPSVAAASAAAAAATAPPPAATAPPDAATVPAAAATAPPGAAGAAGSCHPALPAATGTGSGASAGTRRQCRGWAPSLSPSSSTRACGCGRLRRPRGSQVLQVIRCQSWAEADFVFSSVNEVWRTFGAMHLAADRMEVRKGGKERVSELVSEGVSW